ncbi:MAG: aquaporin [Flavobacteriales bacterium]|nr:aquaporin [Flavobacteriales bacterium]
MIGLTANPIAIGAIIAIMVYVGIHISGAHYNPAVTVAMIIRRLTSPKEAVYYILSQLIGAFLAALFVFWFNSALIYIEPSETASVFQILFIEFAFTFFLILVIFYVATDNRTSGNSYYGLAIGSTVTIISFAGGGISGGAFNPAVGTGPILVDAIMGNGNPLSHLWYYLVGPIVGAIIAALFYKFYID